MVSVAHRGNFSVAWRSWLARLDHTQEVARSSRAATTHEIAGAGLSGAASLSAASHLPRFRV